MEYGSLDRLLATLESREQAKLDQQLASARQEADKVYERMLTDSAEKRQLRRKKMQHQLQERKSQQLTRFSMQQQLAIDQFKEELIETELAKVQAVFSQLPEKDYLAFLARTLKQYEIPTEKPTIQVPTRYYTAASARFGASYQVLENATLTSGFLLAFKNYDINLEISKFFKFHQQVFTRKMMHYLFEKKYADKGGESSSDKLSEELV